MKGKKLLLVEDDPDLLEVLRLTFENEGYQTVLAKNGEEALKLARRHDPDMVLLDIMLPGRDGIEVCREMRSDPSLKAMPVLMLTAKAEEADVVLGLGVGADDYMVKPARPRELLARVKTLLRRAQPRDPTVTDEVMVRGELVIDPVRFEVRAGEWRVRLTPTEFRLLQTLASHPGRVFRRNELLDHAVGSGVVVTERTIDTHIKSVRQKLERHGDWIETIRGVGYSFRDLAEERKPVRASRS
ncbi:MAG: response regulator transcription factor [Planctomycetota bacterium]|nr:MAG: response regulator transcription factor [Planctomycetota bacterium]